MLPSDSPSLNFHELSCLHRELVWVYDRVVAPGSRVVSTPRERGNWAWYIRSGTGTVHANGAVIDLKPGMWIFLPNVDCQHTMSADMRLISINFFCQWPSGVNFVKLREAIILPGNEHPDLLRKAERLERMVSAHFPELHEYKLQGRQPTDPVNFLRLQALFMGWLESWLRICLRHDATVTPLRIGDDRSVIAARYLNAAPLEREFPRAGLLEATRLSMVHLTRVFHVEFGLTPHQYWEQRRLQYARNQLETTDAQVKEIAYRLGFRSDAHFAVWFRRLTGLRPSEYRQQAQAG